MIYLGTVTLKNYIHKHCQDSLWDKCKDRSLEIGNKSPNTGTNRLSGFPELIRAQTVNIIALHKMLICSTVLNTEGKQNDMTATVGFQDLTGQGEALWQFNFPHHSPSSSARSALRKIKGFLSFSRTRLKSLCQDTGLHLPPPGLQADTFLFPFLPEVRRWIF